MKKICFALSALALAAGCTVSELGGDAVSCDKPVFTAGFETPTPDTRVYVDSGLKTRWTEDDRISIFTLTYNEQYRFDGKTGDTEGPFTSMDNKLHTGAEVPAVYAVYPYSEATAITSEGVVSLNLPAVQDYAEGSYGLGANTMVAVTPTKESRELCFKNLCGYLVIKLYGDATIKSITLSGNDGERLSGPATVAPVYGQEPAVRLSDAAGGSITLDCGEKGVTLGKTAEEATAFWFAVPPVTFSKGFTVRITNTEQWSMEKSVTAERSIVRNVMNSMAALPLEAADFDLPRQGNIEFEDANFKAYCVRNFDKDGDGEISYAEALDVTGIHVNTDNIESLGGIEYFNNLTYLYCLSNQLTSLDVSNNTQLTTLYCYDNQLTSLDVSNCTELTVLHCSYNQLTSLDVSKNTKLTRLYCERNQLMSLDISNNTQLTWLCCNNNELTSLDVSNNIKLTQLDCFYNQLTDLNVSNCSQLTELKCYDNQLTSLDVSNNTKLTDLRCQWNQLTSLDVSNCTKLTRLSCYDNQLTSLDVSNNTQLTELSCYDNQLTSLDVGNNTRLTDLQCSSNRLTSLDVSNCTKLTELHCQVNQLKSLDVSNCTKLTSLYCERNQLTSLDVSNYTQLRGLYCYDNQLTSLDVSNCTQLKNLYCGANQLTSLDVNNNTQLTRLECYSNQLTSLDVSKNTQLTYLDCHDNPYLTEIWLKTGQTIATFNYDKNVATIKYKGEESVEFGDANFKAYCVQNFDKDGDGEISYAEALDVTRIEVNTDNIESLVGVEHFVNLTYLDCRGTDGHYDPDTGTSSGLLKSLDVSNCTQLADLYCSYNKLTSLDVSKNTQLTELVCNDNQLTSLDVSKNTQLTILRCDDNHLSSLDVCNNTQLTELYCSWNQLTGLDVSKNNKLIKLECTVNSLTSLDVSNSTQLTGLWCYENQLTSLDVSKNTQLTYLYCHTNQLTSLDVGNCTQLTWLHCYYNELTSLDVSNNTQLIGLSCQYNPYLTEIWLYQGQTINYFTYDRDVATIKYK